MADPAKIPITTGTGRHCPDRRERCPAEPL
jgi:hypothetical protein